MNNLAEINIVFKLNFKCLTFGLTNPSWILTSITQAFHSTYQRSSLPSLPPSLLPPSLPHSSLPPSLTSSFPLIPFFLPSFLPSSLPPTLLLPFFLASFLPPSPSLNFFPCRSRTTHSPLLSLPPHSSALNCYSPSSCLSNSLIHFFPPSFSPSLLPFSPSLPTSFSPSRPSCLPSFLLPLPPSLPSSFAFFSLILRLTTPSLPLLSFFCQLLRSFLLLPITHPRFPISVPLITLLISPSSHSQVPLFPSLSLNNHPQFLHLQGFPTSLTHPLPP